MFANTARISLKKNKIPPCNEISKKFIIENLPEQFLFTKQNCSEYKQR